MILLQSPILDKFTANVADSYLIVFILDDSSKKTWRQFIGSWLKLERISTRTRFIRKYFLHSKLWYQRQAHQVPIVKLSLDLVQVISLLVYYHVLLKVWHWIWVGLDSFVFFAFLARVKELKETRSLLWVGPDVDFDDFGFFDIFEYGFVGEKDGIRHDFAFF